jgi:hypothetical protein
MTPGSDLLLLIFDFVARRLQTSGFRPQQTLSVPEACGLKPDALVVMSLGLRPSALAVVQRSTGSCAASQSSMPPLRLLTWSNPKPVSSAAAVVLRTPARQMTITS